MALITPEYQALIDSLNAQFGRQKAQAEASGIGEAQRRGLINPTGTSDIEMGLRQSKVAPIEQAQQSTIGNLLAQLSQDEQNKKFTTSEREAGQGWQSGENLANRNWQTGERTGTQGWQSGENLANRTWEDQSLNKQRGWLLEDQKKQSKNWWKDALGGLISGSGQGIGQGIGSKITRW